MLRWLACFALLACGACAGNSADDEVVHRDFAHVDQHVADLGTDGLVNSDAGGDLAGGDMARLTWTEHSMGSQRLWNVWSNGPGFIFIVGDGTTLLKSTDDGSTFNADPSTKPGTGNFLGLAVAGAGPPSKPMYISGGPGALWGYTGDLVAGTGAWNAEDLSTTNTINGVWVAPDGTVFAVGAGNTAKKKDPTSGMWSDMGGITTSCFNLWGGATGSGYVLYAVGYDSSVGAEKGMIWKSVNGGAFVAQTSGTTNPLYAVWGASATDLYAVGDQGTILHSDGAGVWTPQTSPVTSYALEAITGASADEVYIVGDHGTVLHRYGQFSMWEQEALPDASEDRNLLGVWASSTEVWIVGKPSTAKPTAPIFKK